MLKELCLHLLIDLVDGISLVCTFVTDDARAVALVLVDDAVLVVGPLENTECLGLLIIDPDEEPHLVHWDLVLGDERLELFDRLRYLVAGTQHVLVDGTAFRARSQCLINGFAAEIA